MNTPWQALTTALGAFPAEEMPPIDPDRVTPGLLGFLSFVFLVVAAVLLFRSMNRQMRKIDPALPPGPSDLVRQADVDVIERARQRGISGGAAADGVAGGVAGGVADGVAGGSDVAPAAGDPRVDG